MEYKKERALFGKFRAICSDVNDPERMGRIRVFCPAVYGEGKSPWASPNLPPNSFSLPKEGDSIWVEFEEGNPRFPIWTGIWYNRGTSPMQDLHPPLTDRNGTVIDKDLDDRSTRPIDEVERSPYRGGLYYDPTKHVLFESETGLRVWVDEDPQDDGGYYIEDRAGNQFQIKDDEKEPFLFTDMNGNIIRTTLDGLIQSNFWGSNLEIGKDFVNLIDAYNGNSVKMTPQGTEIRSSMGNTITMHGTSMRMKCAGGAAITLSGGTIILHGTVLNPGPLGGESPSPKSQETRSKRPIMFPWFKWKSPTSPVVFSYTSEDQELYSNEDIEPPMHDDHEG
jgi:hypothetical protein